MASQADMQDLIRLLTSGTGKNKLPIMTAMARVKLLQAANLRSISDIASADLSAVTAALSDPKAAKALHTSCKAQVSDAPDAKSKKRPLDPSSSSPSSKRTKSVYSLPEEPKTPQELEASLALPQPSQDEERIEKCVLVTNRAPLVIAFAVSLLKYTMPEQPISARLSLGQAVCAMNSRSKAVSIGLEKESATNEWGTGQPRLRVMGREVAVLKRGGYDWKEEGEVVKPEKVWSMFEKKPEVKNEWAVSASVTSKQSTFIARSIEVNSSAQARSELTKLMAANSELRDASHNITAWRIQGDQGRIIEECNDDGESGGGRHILGVMQGSDVVGVLLVVTRWYGGVMLGTDRWRIMSQVSGDALSQRLRVTGIVGSEALWGLDLQQKSETPGEMPICRPEQAKAYLLKSFPSPVPEDSKEKKRRTAAVVDKEKEDNLGLLLGALDMLFSSWVEHVSQEELDRRAWGWYVSVRPDVASGAAGWGGKGQVKLADILRLRRKG